jgi:hypothetical protein
MLTTIVRRLQQLRRSIALSGGAIAFGWPREWHNPGDNNFGILPYNQISPFGFNGAFYYGRVTFGF